MSNSIEAQLQKEPDRRFYYGIMTAIIAGLVIWSTSAVKLSSLEESGLKIAENIIKGILTPDLDMLFSLTKQGVPYLLFETICIAFLGTIFGAILAIPFSFLMAPSIVPEPVAWFFRIFLIIIRTIPSLVYGLLFIRVTGLGPFAGVLTMSVTSIGMIAKLYVDIIEDLDRGVLEAMDAIGCTTYEKIRFGIIPQLFSSFLSVTIYRFDINLRDASVLGLVGAGGIGAPLIFAMNSYRWHLVGSILIGLVILILAVEVFSNKTRSKLIKG